MANEEPSLDTSLSQSEKTDIAKEFITFFVENIQSIINRLKVLNKELAKEITEVSEADQLIRDTIHFAYELVDNFDSLLYYLDKTDFERIKSGIKNGNNKELEKFLSEMDDALLSIMEAYNDYVEKCKHISSKCIKYAQTCANAEAETNANNTGAYLVGGGISAPSIVGGLVFRKMSLVLSMISGLIGMGSGVVVAISVSELKRLRDVFQEMSSKFQELSKNGENFKCIFNDIHLTLQSLKREHAFIGRIDHDDITNQERLCSTLDTMKVKFQPQLHHDIIKARNTIKTLETSYICS